MIGCSERIANLSPWLSASLLEVAHARTHRHYLIAVHQMSKQAQFEMA
jgi:hypothetical protein